jgi:hypothetical protein
MGYKRKTWQEKLQVALTPEVTVTNKKFADIPEGASMFIATPMLVDAYIKNITKGRTYQPAANAQGPCHGTWR